MNESEYYWGSLGWRNLDDGRVIVLTPMFFGKVAIHLGKQRDPGFDAEWSYPPEARESAFDALRSWDGEGDPPPGWTRAYPPYYRRRPNGEPSEEYIAP